MLIKKKGCKIWIFRTRVNGKTWERSTGESDRRRAHVKVAELERLAQLQRKRGGGSLGLSQAIYREIEHVESDVSAFQADRLSYAFQNFLKRVGDLPIERITFEMVEDYQRFRLKEAAKETVNKELFAILRMLRNNGVRLDKPSCKPGRATKQRKFTPDELRMFFSHCQDEHKALFLLMLLTGARPAELLPSDKSGHLALLKEELDPETGRVEIRTAKLRGNEEKTRIFRLPEFLTQMIAEHARQIPGPHAFPPMGNLARVFNKTVKRAGIQKLTHRGRITAHCFRHTYGSYVAEAVGQNPFIVMQALGHSNMTTTKRYCHPESPVVNLDLDRILSIETHETGQRWGKSVGKKIAAPGQDAV